MDTATTESPKTGIISALDHTGDFKVTWNHNNPDEVEIARTTFDKLKKKNYASFRMRGDGTRGEQIREFDPSAEQIIMVPAIAGG